MPSQAQLKHELLNPITSLMVQEGMTDPNLEEVLNKNTIKKVMSNPQSRKMIKIFKFYVGDSSYLQKDTPHSLLLLSIVLK